MRLEELVLKYGHVLIKNDGSLYGPDNSKAIVRVSTSVYDTLLSKADTITTIGSVTLSVTLLKDGVLKLAEHIDLPKMVDEYSNLEIDTSTGEIKTLTETHVGVLPANLINSLCASNSNKVSLGGTTLYVTRDTGTNSLRISKTDSTLNSIDDFIQFGLDNKCSNITVTSEGTRYRVGSNLHNLNKIYTDKEVSSMISRYDKGILSITEKGVYATTRLYNEYATAVNIHIIRDSRYSIIFDFITNKERTLTDFYDAEWLNFIKSRNKSESGGIVIITEKQALPDATRLFVNSITTKDDIVMTYNKSIDGIDAQLLEYSNNIPLSQLTNINTDVLVVDFSTIVHDWDTVFDYIDNGTIVAVTVNDSSLYMTLNMILETFEKQYHFRKFIDTLIGINTLSINYQGGTTDFDVRYDYIYNNKQFQILLGSRVYTKADLQDKKYKHYYLSIAGQHKSVEEVLRDILIHANEIGAHDISLSAGAPPSFRKGKNLVCTFIQEKLLPYVTESMFLEIVQDAKLQERFRKNPGAGLPVSYSVPGVGRYRVNIYSQRGSIALSLRKIPSEIPTMDWCGIPREVQEVLKVAKMGLILVTGPTGSGKSTTLASIIDYYNETREHKIITTEDPIEYLHSRKNSLIEQIEIGQDSDSFLETLHSNMRNNPDILLMGEIRTADDLSVALNASVTGHLVLATLHTSGAIATIERAIDMTPAESKENIKSLLSQNLVCTITQQLLPKLGGGMVPCHEVMVMNTAVKSAISTGTPQSIGSIKSQLSTNRASGMRDMDYSIAQHVIAGNVSMSEAEIYAHSVETVKRYVETNNIKKQA